MFPVRTDGFQATAERPHKERGAKWVHDVQCRIEFAQDLHGANAVYYEVCSINFPAGKQIPLSYQYASEVQKYVRGRPREDHHDQREQAFLKVAAYWDENDDEHITISGIVQKIKKYCGEDAYSVRWMKKINQGTLWEQYSYL